jgi:hypothetical protein
MFDAPTLSITRILLSVAGAVVPVMLTAGLHVTRMTFAKPRSVGFQLWRWKQP